MHTLAVQPEVPFEGEAKRVRVQVGTGLGVDGAQQAGQHPRVVVAQQRFTAIGQGEAEQLAQMRQQLARVVAREEPADGRGPRFEAEQVTLHEGGCQVGFDEPAARMGQRGVRTAFKEGMHAGPGLQPLDEVLFVEAWRANGG